MKAHMFQWLYSCDFLADIANARGVLRYAADKRLSYHKGSLLGDEECLSCQDVDAVIINLTFRLFLSKW